MARLLVRPGPPLEGTVELGGAKNSVLKLMAASMMVEGETVLHGVPHILDVEWMADVLKAMGATVQWRGPKTLAIDVPSDLEPTAPYELVERMRASIVVLGPLLARFGRATVALPGGDDFGPRPIDMHLTALEQLGATFTTEHGDLQ